jgi:hypothetical protein
MFDLRGINAAELRELEALMRRERGTELEKLAGIINFFIRLQLARALETAEAREKAPAEKPQGKAA